MKNKTHRNLRGVFFIIGILVVRTILAQNTPENIIDSAGYKQGCWVEFEARPEEVGITINDDLLNNNATIDFEYDYSNLEIYKFVGMYYNSLREGIWEIYDSIGNLINIITYKGGIIHGSFESYYMSGEVRIKGYINSGQKLSRVEKYNKKGKLEKSYFLDTRDLVRAIVK